MVTLGYLAAKSCKFLHEFFLQIYGRHFESAAMNSTCFQDPIGFIKFSHFARICASANGSRLVPQDFSIIT